MKPRDIAELHLERVRRLDQVGSGDPAEELRIKLVGFAALARAAEPTATHVRLFEDDQSHTDMVADALILADGREVGVDAWDNPNLDALMDLGSEFGFNMLLLPHKDSPLLQVEGNDKHGYTMTLDVAAALASHPPVLSAVERGRWAVHAYGARYDAHGDEVFLAADLMGDLRAMLAEHGIEQGEARSPLAVLWRGEFTHFDDDVRVMDVDGMLDQYSGNEVADLLEAKAELSAVYAPDDPIMVALDERIEEIRAEEEG